MTFFPPLLIIVTALTVCVSLLFLIGLFRVRRGRSEARPFVSVVVAARNEEAYVGACLEALVRQTYPADRYEVLVADDDSEDRTREIVAEFGARHPRVRLVTPGPEDEGLRAKKRPLNAGIRRSRGEIILTTDADCRVRPGWVSSTMSCFESDIEAVVGFSQVDSSGGLTWVERLQGVDFLALMSAAAGAAGLGFPLAASGQNLAYRKSLFYAAGGFGKIAHRPSGDDVLLLQVLRRAGKGRIVFNLDPEAFNTTCRFETMPGFLRQRLRWASNAAFQLRLNRPFFVYIASLFLRDLLILVLLLRSVLTATSPTVALLCFLSRSVADLLVMLRGATVFHRPDLLSLFPLWAILQPFYVTGMGVLGTFAGFAWKGRSHGA